MKKALTIILAAIICFSICACGQSPTLETKYEQETQSNYVPAPTEKEFTAYDGYLAAKDYINNQYNRKLKEETRANSIDYFEIGSYDNKGDDGTFFTYKFYGTFAAFDKYGDIKGWYKYSWTVKVRKDNPELYQIVLDNDREYGAISVSRK